VARIDDGSSALGIEVVRNLSASEVSSLGEAQRILTSLTSKSPYQTAVDAHATVTGAFEDLRAETTESEAARQERAWQALQLAVAAMTAASAELSLLASEVTGTDGEVAAVASAAERLRATAEWQSLQEAVATRAPQFRWADEGVGPEVLLSVDNGSWVHVQLLLDAVMQGLAVITAEVFMAAANEITAASWVIRGLEAEVLFGRAALAAFPVGEADVGDGKIQFRDLPVDVMAAAQSTLRRARALLAAAADSTQPQTAQRDPASSTPNAGAAARESTASASETEWPAGADAGPDEAANSTVHPPVDLYHVAQHLAETLSAVEEAYGELPRIEEMFDAVEQDSATYGSLLRQVGLSLQRTKEALAAAGAQPARVNLPPTNDDIAALTLDDLSPQVRLRQQISAELLVVQGAVDQLESLRQPTELQLGPGGLIVSARFDPAAPARVRGWMLQAARMAEHSAEVGAAATGADARPDGSAEESWLAGAAAICLADGLHEAALLYLAALAAASASGGDDAEKAPTVSRRELAAETVRRFAAGDTRNASAVAVLLVHAMWQAIEATTPVAAGEVTAGAAPGAAPTPGESDSPVGAQ